jgi:hypothetical protein
VVGVGDGGVFVREGNAGSWHFDVAEMETNFTNDINRISGLWKEANKSLIF